jgi:hypothetical protein
MPKVITITKKEATATLVNRLAPDGFRFAGAADFHKGGVRVQQLQIYILQWGKTNQLVEYWFFEQTPRNWMQWLLNNERVFIKVGNREGVDQLLSYFIIPTDEFLNGELNVL